MYFVVRDVPLHVGGGRHATSPNGHFLVNASALKNANGLARDAKQVLGKITLCRGDDDFTKTTNSPLLEIDVTPSGVENEMAYREIYDLVKWSDDSSTVAIDLPHVTIEITPKVGHPLFLAPPVAK
jgi:hypothetical protein